MSEKALLLGLELHHFRYLESKLRDWCELAALQEAAKKKEMRYRDIKKIEKGIRRHFHDDITVIVIYLDHQKESFHSKGTLGSITAPVDVFSYNSDDAEEKQVIGAL
ncbi:hypothetical protein CQW23_20275 [Capsicum baccatum]|uniref:Uncharacterized protein n=1 Tax=Capsicum baccatum TaxID=33114 RepID=A0A2G2W857_CAPBA|nr:hypothetical protein CQW23_20275 [Capsicum baccatum]